MVVILEAFGELKSQPINVPEVTKYSTTLRLMQPSIDTDILINGSVLPTTTPTRIHAEFAYSGKDAIVDEKHIPIFTLNDIWKDPI